MATPDEGSAPAAAPGSGTPGGGGRPPEGGGGRTRLRLLAVVATLLVLAFLKWAAVAMMPLVFAVFLVVLLWPLQVWLERRMPRRLAYGLTVLVLLAVLAGFFLSLAWSGRQVLERGPEYGRRLDELVTAVREWAAGHGLSLPEDGGMTAETAGRAVRAALVGLSSSLTTIALILAFTILGVLEVHTFHAKARNAFRRERHGRALVETAGRIAVRFQQYLWARVVVALLQGLTVWLFSLVVGLDFALVWGLVAFLLNFVPTVGSVLAVIPPSLFALVQFDGWAMPLVVLVGNSLLQLVMGNYVDPRIEGRFLSLSPVVVLFAIVFWGWLWGIGGALLGVPIMVALAIVADESPETRWLAAMIARDAGRRRSEGADARVVE